MIQIFKFFTLDDVGWKSALHLPLIWYETKQELHFPKDFRTSNFNEASILLKSLFFFHILNLHVRNDNVIIYITAVSNTTKKMLPKRTQFLSYFYFHLKNFIWWSFDHQSSIHTNHNCKDTTHMCWYFPPFKKYQNILINENFHVIARYPKCASQVNASKKHYRAIKTAHLAGSYHRFIIRENESTYCIAIPRCNWYVNWK